MGGGGRAPASFVDLVEACYRLDLDEGAWVAGLAAAARPLIGGDLGAAAFTYALRGDGGLDVGEISYAPAMDVGWLKDALRAAPPTFVREWMDQPSGSFAKDAAFPRSGGAAAVAPGVRDILGLHGRDPGNHGIWLGAPQRSKVRLTPARRALLARVASHAAAGQRVRRSLARDPNVE